MVQVVVQMVQVVLLVVQVVLLVVQVALLVVLVLLLVVLLVVLVVPRLTAVGSSPPPPQSLASALRAARSGATHGFDAGLQCAARALGALL